MISILKTTGKNIKVLRAAKGLSQKRLAETIPMAQAFLSRIERGMQEPSLAMLEKIANALGCNSSDLMGEQEIVDNENKALLPVEYIPTEDKSTEQNIIIEREEGDTLIRYILPPTIQTYKFLAEQLNKSILSDSIEQIAPDKAVVVTNTGHHNKNSNNITVKAKK